MKRYDLELTATGPVMEESKEGAFVPFSEVSGLAGTVMKMADRCKLLTDLLREARNPLITAMEASSEDESTAIEELIDRIDALLAGQVPDHPEQPLDMVQEGWQLVPVEPTESMIGHGCGASVMVVSEVVMAWRAMLAAAPKHQGGESCATEPPLSSKA